MKTNVTKHFLSFLPLFLLVFLLALAGTGTQKTLAETTSATTGTWEKSGSNLKYLYNNTYFKSSFRKIRGYWYYFDANGYVKTGLIKYKNAYYYGLKSTAKGKCGRLVTGKRKISGKLYYFSDKDVRCKYGRMLTGWQTIDGQKYYMNTKTGVAYTGLKAINSYTYYFNSSGVLQTSTTIKRNGLTYTADDEGKCTVSIPAKDSSVNDKLLFFTRFESGTDAYAQVGGDHGNACGKYQFDYRYSLLPLIKYCYSSNPAFFAEFKPYAAYTNAQKSKLRNNKAFYKAWLTIYHKSPKGFASYQDAYAKQEYYDVTARYLSAWGINLSKRSDIVKGAVFSYSIQHGQLTAANAVKACKIKSTTSDTTFIKRLYNYRIKKFAAYKFRYTAEKKLALSLL